MESRAAFERVLRAGEESALRVTEAKDAAQRAEDRARLKRYDEECARAARLYASPAHGMCALVGAVRSVFRARTKGGPMECPASSSSFAVFEPVRAGCLRGYLASLGCAGDQATLINAQNVHRRAPLGAPEAVPAELLADVQCCDFGRDLRGLLVGVAGVGDIAEATQLAARICDQLEAWHRAGRWAHDASDCLHARLLRAAPPP